MSSSSVAVVGRGFTFASVQEQYLEAARAANALVKQQLFIESSNRPSHQKPENFMADLETRKEELSGKAQVIDEGLRQRRTQDLQRLDSDLTAGELHIRTLTDNQRELAKDMDKLEGEARQKRQDELIGIGKQREMLMTNQRKFQREIESIQQELDDFRELDNIGETAQASVDVKKGNCDEMSSIAFLFLRLTTIRPLELIETGVVRKMVMGQLVEDRHQFVLLGRQANDKLTAPESWSDSVVVCDAWDERAYPAKEGLKRRLGELKYPTDLYVRMREDKA